jgi:hypothetical protein
MNTHFTKSIFVAIAIAFASVLSVGPAMAGRQQLPQHVFVIVLENKSFDETFGPNSPAPYLSKTLTAQGELLTQYYATGHASLDNYISMISGQAPNSDTQGDCQFYTDFIGLPGLDSDGQAVGQGCVYPSDVKTIANQLENRGLTWAGYMEDMGNDTPAESATCRHPALNTRDDTQTARPTDQYAARHNPFVYFHSIVDTPSCDAHDVPLDQLTADLTQVSTTPNFSMIVPNLCHDGHDAPCADGEPGGLVSADQFLQQWVPKITASDAFNKNGMLIVAFDEAEISGSDSDARACCGEMSGPNTLMPGITGPGGGLVGAVILSKFVKARSVNNNPYNHYALLRSVENLFGLAHLGFAGAAGLQAFGSDVYNASSQR